MGIEREDGLKAWRKNFERQQITVPWELKLGKGHIGNKVKELGGDKRQLKG
jgi:hypothetical protein